MEKTIHQGRNIKRFREMLGIKQEGLALELGDDWNQRKISLLEQKEVVEADILQQVSAVLKIPVEAIENFDEEQAVNIIANTFHDSAVASTFNEGAQANFSCTFNPLDKVMELFERLLASEREKVELMKEILGKMK
jgi:transcriptional regulator with XRE-family HTH domain